QLEMLMDNVKQSHVKAENELEVQFQKVEFLIRSWKCEFDQELKDLYRRQRANVQRQTDHLQDIASSLSKALLRAKDSKWRRFYYFSHRGSDSQSFGGSHGTCTRNYG
ncbi:unnamed protein product, partial [Meganyctiphanes norvegica]